MVECSKTIRHTHTHTHTQTRPDKSIPARVNKKLHKVPQVVTRTAAQHRWDHLLTLLVVGIKLTSTELSELTQDRQLSQQTPHITHWRSETTPLVIRVHNEVTTSGQWHSVGITCSPFIDPDPCYRRIEGCNQAPRTVFGWINKHLKFFGPASNHNVWRITNMKFNKPFIHYSVTATHQRRNHFIWNYVYKYT